MKKQIEALRVNILKAVDEARGVLEGAKDGRLTAEEQAKYDKIIADVNGMRDNVKRMETQITLEEGLRSSAGVMTPGTPAAAETAGKGADDKATNQFRSFLRSGAIGNELRALQADSPEAGGYIMPPQEISKKLIMALDDMLFIRKLATVIPLNSSDSLGCPSLDADPEDGDWTPEITSVDEDTAMDFGMRELKPHLVSKLVKVSMKLINKAALSVEDLVISRLAYKFGVTEEKGYLTGNGSGQPLGLFTASASGISTDRDFSTGNSATSIAFDGLIGCKYNVKEQYQRNAAWLFHREAVSQLAQLKDGEGRYIWMVSPIVGQPDSLLGRPMYISENAPHVFTASQYVGLYGDFKHYWIADNLSWAVQRLQELYARTNQIGFIGRKETDGMPVLEEAFSRVKLAAS